MQNLTEQEFIKLASFIKQNFGINLKKEKLSMLSGRLSNVLLKRNMKNFTEYYEYILSDKTGYAAQELVNCVTTNHTFFMRETQHFEYFREIVLPWIKSTVRDKDLRIWCAGCSTGEEPYTLAMIIDDFFGKEKYFWDTTILATDISSKVLNEAIRGVYTQDEIMSLPAAWRINYFKALPDKTYTLIDSIKKQVLFRKFNLMEKVFPFKKKMHVIFCRNVMIYFADAEKYDLADKFYNFTETGGYLFIGHSETLDRNKTKYKYVMPAVYRKA